jgi:hypothetical protein
MPCSEIVAKGSRAVNEVLEGIKAISLFAT